MGVADMTPAIALLMVSLLLFFLGRRHKAEEGAQHVLGVSFVAFLLSLMLFAINVKAADEPAPAEGERYVVMKFTLAQQIAARLEAQAAEIKRLRDELKNATAPKECI